METKEILELLRKHGTENTVQALMSVDKDRLLSMPLRKQEVLLAKLIALLEKKKVIRRGHIVELLSEERPSETERETEGA